MVSEIVKKEIVFLVQLESKNHERLVSTIGKGEDLFFESVESAAEAYDKASNHTVIAFIIGSDIQDPVQSAQHLHVYNKYAAIVILSGPQHLESLKKAIKFSPFIGMDVYCLDESNEEQLQNKLAEILANKRKAAKFRKVLAETDPVISYQPSTQTNYNIINQSFINKLMDIAPVGITIVGRNGRILGWNREAARIFKKTEANVLGSGFSRLFGYEEQYKIRAYLKKSLGKNQADSVDSLKLERKRKDISKQVLSITAAPFAHSKGTEKVLILTIKDVTEQWRAQQELKWMNEILEKRVEERTSDLISYQEQLRSLASRLSISEENQRQQLASELHDNLGQLLAVGKMKVELLKMDPYSSQSTKDIDDLRSLMDEALTYTRNLMSDLKPPPSIGEDLTAGIFWVAGKMEKHGLKVTVDDDERPKPLDEKVKTTLLQSVRELLYNIVKHTSEKEAVVTVRCIKEQVRITVIDKGGGFEPKSVKMSSSSNGGFGLFNIRERIDFLGGRLNIHSEIGNGTRVSLIMPLNEETKKPESHIKAAGRDKTMQKPANPEEKIKLLIVDDQKMVREGFRKLIEEQDDMMVIGEAADGKEAVNLAHELSPDIILMDVSMPVMDGIKATRKITSTMPNVKIIGVSLHEEKEVEGQMRKAGAAAYITKTEAFEYLIVTIRAEASSRKK